MTTDSVMHPWKTRLKHIKDGDSYDPKYIIRSNDVERKHTSVTPFDQRASGTAAEFAVAAALCEIGGTVYSPHTHMTKSDLVYEDEERNLYRIQVKTAHSAGREGKIRFNSSTNSNQSYEQYGIDFFGVYYPKSRKVFLVPIGSITSRDSEILRRYDQDEYQIWPIKTNE